MRCTAATFCSLIASSSSDVADTLVQRIASCPVHAAVSIAPVRTLPQVGDQVAGYRIERQLGRGGMGLVYLAEQVRLRRWVALKLIVPELAEDEEFRRRFERESQMAASLDH